MNSVEYLELLRRRGVLAMSLPPSGPRTETRPENVQQQTAALANQVADLQERIDANTTRIARLRASIAENERALAPVLARHELDREIAAERAANPKLTYEQGYALALSKNPDLYGAITDSVGADAPGVEDSIGIRLVRAVEQELEAHPRMTRAAAFVAVLNRDQTLYEA